MANNVTITKLEDGARFAIFHVFMQSDGASGELVKSVVIDPLLDFVPPKARKPSMSIERLWYDISGFTARLEFDYLTDETPVWTCSPANGTHMDFSHFGGLKDRSGAQDGSGKLMISTSGFTEATDSGSIIIKVKKD